MRKRIIFIGLVLLAAGCNRDLLPGSPRSSHEPSGRQRADSSAKEDVIPPGEHVYLTAVRFPDGYAWDLDTCAVEGSVWIDLYRDGSLVRSVPADRSVHPDMHRYVGGHLYTDYSTDTETVVSRDGKELFRFEGREALRGFLVREDGVHTLGQDRDGEGFTYRVEGRTVYRSETGTILGSPDGTPGGALTEDGEDVLYTCCVPSGKGKQYVVMRGAEAARSPLDGDGVMAFGLVGGKVCRVQSYRRRMALLVEDSSVALIFRAGEELLWCRFVPWADDVLALLCASGPGGKRFLLQTVGGKNFQPAEGETVGDILADGGRMGWTETGPDGGLHRIRWCDGTVTEVAASTVAPGSASSPSASGSPGNYLASSRCALLHNGHLLLALTGRDGAPNSFQMDNESKEFPINGYFTSVTVE